VTSLVALQPLQLENKMDAMEFWKKYGTERVLQLCADVGTTYNYWKHIANKRKRPGPDLARAMVKASGGKLKLDKLLIPRDEMKTVK
jgi:hypothetical protein